MCYCWMMLRVDGCFNEDPGPLPGPRGVILHVCAYILPLTFHHHSASVWHYTATKWHVNTILFSTHDKRRINQLITLIYNVRKFQIFFGKNVCMYDYIKNNDTLYFSTSCILSEWLQKISRTKIIYKYHQSRWKT